MRSRLLASYYTGPLGHFVAGVMDFGGLLIRWKWAQLVSRFRKSA